MSILTRVLVSPSVTHYRRPAASLPFALAVLVAVLGITGCDTYDPLAEAPGAPDESFVASDGCAVLRTVDTLSVNCTPRSSAKHYATSGTDAMGSASKAATTPTVWIEQPGYGDNGTSYPGFWADDFTVPGGETFAVTDVRLELRIDEGSALTKGVPAEGFDLVFYADVGGEPASTPLIEATGQTSYTRSEGTHSSYPFYTIRLDEPATFSTGTYWMAVRTGRRLQESQSEFYFFLRRIAEAINAESHTLVMGREGWEPVGTGFAFALMNIPNTGVPSDPAPSDPAPTVSIEGPSTTQEGSTVAFEAKTGTDDSALRYEWDADYDGTAFDVDGTGQQFEYAYSQSGTYTVALRAFDGTAYSVVTTASVSVDRAEPVPNTIALGAIQVNASKIKAGVPFVLRVPFTGSTANTRHDYTCTIDLGLGLEPQQGVITGSKNGNLTCLGNRLVYSAPGSYAATVEVADSRGGRAQATTTLDVQPHKRTR